MRVLVDMNLSPDWCSYLRARGIASEHWSSLGPEDSDDSDILAFARLNDFVILTHDLDWDRPQSRTGSRR